MRFRYITHAPIHERTLFWKRLIGYRIDFFLDTPIYVRLQSRRKGITKKGRYSVWRKAGDSFSHLTEHSFNVMRSHEDRGKYRFTSTFRGTYEFRGEGYTRLKKPKYIYSHILTLEFP